MCHELAYLGRYMKIILVIFTCAWRWHGEIDELDTRPDTTFNRPIPNAWAAPVVARLNPTVSARLTTGDVAWNSAAIVWFGCASTRWVPPLDRSCSMALALTRPCTSYYCKHHN
jgi:hypothetical protein